MTDILSAVAEHLGGLVRKTWVDDMRQWGERVTLYRQYYDGEHRIKLSPEMKSLLMLADTKVENFNDNYCELIVNAMADRLKVTAIEGDSKQATDWADEIKKINRFDSLQMDVHEAAIKDGDTFVMADFDNTVQRATMAHEPAWDGDCGMMVVYDRMKKKIVAAVKVWYEGDARYVNIYFTDKIIKMTFDDDNGLQAREETPTVWTDQTLGALGVPVVHFRNRWRTGQTLGKSELTSAIPLQDALNMTMLSMVANCLLTAFGLRKAKGFRAPENIAPGNFIEFGADVEDAALLAAMDVDLIKQSEMGPFIEQANWIIEQKGNVTRTPLPIQMGGDNQSGEALKQRENGLLGKIGQFQVRGGNSWEDTFTMLHKIETAFANKKPAETLRWDCKWKDAQLRNDAEEIASALAIGKELGAEIMVEELARVKNWDKEKQEKILQGLQGRQEKMINAALVAQQNFKSVSVPQSKPSPPAPLPQGEGSQVGAGNGKAVAR